MTPEISVVIPAHNEAGAIAAVARQTADTLRDMGRNFEIIVVNDGSVDATSDALRSLAATAPECREMSLGRRVGQGDALLAGLSAARGRWIVTLDGDGQNDPSDIPIVLVPVIAGEADLVCGWRRRRADNSLRRAMSKLANAVRRRVLNDGVHDAGCQLRAFRCEIVGVLRPMELVQSFVPALAVAAGFRVAEMPVRHHPRRHGQSKYTFARLSWRPMIAMLQLRRELRTKRKAASR